MGTKLKQPKLKIRQIESALRKTNGLMSHAAELLNVTRQAIDYRVKTSKRLQEVMAEIENRLIDKSENVVYHHMQNKNLTAAIFHLKTKGKARGWVEKHEVDAAVKLNQDDWVKKMEDLETGRTAKEKTKTKK